MTARILLVRHGAHDLLGRILCGRTAGIGLNQAGLDQAEHLATVLSREKPEAVYTSPRRRARQTAEPVAISCGLPLQHVDALDEIDLGGWTGLSFDRLAQDPLWQSWNRDRLHHRPPGGESMLEVQVRLAAWLQKMSAAHAGQVVIAVSHADVIKAACCLTLGLSIDAHGRFDIDPASVTTVLAGDWGLKLVGLNRA